MLDLSKRNTVADVCKKDLEKKRDCELVTGIFRMLTHTERTRGCLEADIKKYPDQGIYHFKAKDGDKVRVPRYVMDHLNSLYTTIGPDDLDIYGRPICKEPIKVYRFSIDVV